MKSEVKTKNQKPKTNKSKRSQFTLSVYNHVTFNKVKLLYRE
jgi:hypothetical protein